MEARDLAEEKEASPKKELKGFTVKEYEKDGIKIQTMDIDEEGAKRRFSVTRGPSESGVTFQLPSPTIKQLASRGMPK